MLQEIREKTQGWIAGTIISIIIISFALWGIHSYFVGAGVNTTVATVNGVDISKEQLTVAYDRLRRQVQAQYGSTVTPKDEPTLKERALRSLVDIEILKQASLSQGFLISDQQVDDYLQSMPDFQVDGQFSLDRFQEVLSATLLTTSEFLDLIKTSLQIDQPRLGIMLSAFGLPEESRYTASLVNQVRDISYLSLPINQFLSPAIVIAPEQIQAYYDAHQRDYKTPEEVSLDYLELSLPDLYARFNPTDTMLKSFYNENINAYTQPMRWQLAGILVPLSPSADQAAGQTKILEIKQALDANPASFDKLAKQNAKAILPTSFVALNQLPTDVQKAVMGLTAADQISDPVQTAQGLVVIKALAVQEPKINAYDAVKAKVREAYVRQHAEDKFAELRDQLADVTYEHPDSLTLAAKTLNLPVKSTALFSRDKAGSDLSQFKKVRDVAFGNDVLNLQTNSDVISLNPETVVVVRVKSHQPSSLLPLKDVAQQITDKLKTQTAEARADKFANTLVGGLQTGASDTAKLISQYQLHWVKVGVMGRYATKVDSAILDSAFRLPRPAKGAVSYGVTRVPNGYAIVSVSGVQDGVLATPKQAAVFTEQVQNSLGFLEYSLYRESAVKRAKVKFSS